MKILKTPWKVELMKLVQNSKKSIKITSPYIKENICNELILQKRNTTKFELITSFKLMSVYTGSLDLNGLETIIMKSGSIKNYPKLHSKIYLFDDEKLIITSSNLTNGGLLNNFEYGVYITEKEIVSEAVNDFNKISTDENTGTVKLSDISAVRKIINKIPSTHSIKITDYKLDSLENKLDTIELPDTILTSSLSGWKLEVFKCVNLIPEQIFSIKQINKYESDLQRIYPKNNHISDKIRQQLQYLRDLGLIEFLGNGNYKKLWK